MKPRLYIDACVLILASQGKAGDDLTDRALASLDRDAEFLFSSIVELETIPKTIFHRYPHQTAFLMRFFARAERVECTSAVQSDAIRRASTDDLGPCDALHVACAIEGRATELVTAEHKKNSLPKAKGITVTTIRV